MASGKGRNSARFSAALGGFGDNYKGNLSSVWGAIDRMDMKKNFAGGGGGDNNEPDKENPPPPPVDRLPSENWEETVKFYFPSSGMKAGGLVRGAGKAVKGRGRGRIV